MALNRAPSEVRPASRDPEVHDLDAESQAPVDVTALATSLRTAFAAPGYRAPQLPGVVLELSALARQAEPEPAVVTRLLEKEPLLSARLLGVANSALYARGTPIVSLRQAVTRLGSRALKDLVLEAALHARVFRAEAYVAPMQALARHASATAHLARLVCRYLPLEAEHAFTCGLLHDVGAAAALIVTGERKPAERPDFDVLAPAIALAHPELGQVVLESWQLAPEIRTVTRLHHERAVGGHVHPLVATLSIAEHLADELGIAGAGALDRAPPLSIADAARAVGLTDKQLHLVRTEAASVPALLS